MRDLIITSTDKKLSYKALTGVGAIEMQDSVGKRFVLSDIIQSEIERQNDETGEMEKAVLTCLIDADGNIYQTLSPTIDDNVHFIMDIFDVKQDEVIVEITQGVSKNKRKFLQLSVI